MAIRRLCCSVVLLTWGTDVTFAWVNPAKKQRKQLPRIASGDQRTRNRHARVASPLFTTREGQEPVCVSRRGWVSQVTGTAAALVTVTTVGGAEPSSAATASTRTTSSKPTLDLALCDPSVSVWQNNAGRMVYLVGTAHISSQSAMLAGDVVHDVEPDAVFVELDAKRIGATGATVSAIQVQPITGGGDATTRQVIQETRDGPGGLIVAASDPSALNKLDDAESSTSSTMGPSQPRSNPFDFRQKAMQAASVAVGNSIRGMYKRLDTSGFKPGEEFVVAVKEGQRIGATIILGDRDVEVTLRRLTQALSETDLNQLMSPDSELEKSMQELLPSGAPNPTMSDSEFKDEMSRYVEVMKAKDNVIKIMGQLRKAAPKLYEALVAERDVYMASGLDQLSQFPAIVAVMGIAHVEGVEAYLQRRGWTSVKLRCPRRGT